MAEVQRALAHHQLVAGKHRSSLSNKHYTSGTRIAFHWKYLMHPFKTYLEREQREKLRQHQSGGRYAKLLIECAKSGKALG